MTLLKDKYQIEETSTTFSFKPFYHSKNRLWWFVFAILLFIGLSAYFLERENYLLLIFSCTITLVLIWYFMKSVLVYGPLRYTFNPSENAVYQSNLWHRNKKILVLDKVVIFRNTEMGSWHFSMGEKKRQFVKSYIISEYFPNKKGGAALTRFENEILQKIETMIQHTPHNITMKQGGFRLNFF
ncbi:hypothetical protein [Sphingobacterium corticibacter]|uniref:Uncharacterized protein n=1 Tax=Sphingobacterium corticibacter TaxID=2171749 RepID=A0A2T8HJ89_9SPHI|nr:hypothetical protein [Sphingobacterium corticibacter]PVH25440.1 hypothetical protein DC487_11050 [Sphingobacterium corticibacter]